MKRKMTALIASICTVMALSISASACVFAYYQPEEPEALRK